MSKTTKNEGFIIRMKMNIVFNWRIANNYNHTTATQQEQIKKKEFLDSLMVATPEEVIDRFIKQPIHPHSDYNKLAITTRYFTMDALYFPIIRVEKDFKVIISQTDSIVSRLNELCGLQFEEGMFNFDDLNDESKWIKITSNGERLQCTILTNQDIVDAGLSSFFIEFEKLNKL